MAAHTPAPHTQTVGACKVNHQANAALRPILEGIHTEEELEGVVEHLHAIQHSCEAAVLEGQMHDPAPLNPKGRPRTAQITGALEGCPRGGGPPPSDEQGGRRCEVCHQPGHNQSKCPLVPQV
ncbi:hypothetical protein FA15DRAFT_606341 [Coprinopsis marcescibilis]|uniref:CCHC-type domain-containing protein n=1 Tax=Coprinopsis marcescibilis TaxID=230819 RepID=A0A5C3K9T3_COPMA|nr:hypothetical protein FA15DRAFT_606341 [Coprinopsis marcescibilis]